MNATPDALRAHLQVMVRDPSWLFLYWIVPAERVAELPPPFRTNAMRWQLRIVRVETAETSIVDVDFEAGNWYLEVVPESHYEVSLGVCDPGGDFFEVVRGNAVHTPPPTISPRTDPEWHISEDAFWRLVASDSGGRPTSAGPKGHGEDTDAPTWPLSPAVSSHDAQKKPRKQDRHP